MRAEAINARIKWPSFVSKFFGPCRVIRASDPRFYLISPHRCMSRRGIHARRLKPYHERPRSLRSEAHDAHTAIALPIVVDYEIYKPQVNYLELEISGRTLRDWLAPLECEDWEKHRIVWNCFHVGFSVHHTYGQYITRRSHEMLGRLVKRLHLQMVRLRADRTFFFLYHYVVGKYGHLPAAATHEEQVVDYIRLICQPEVHREL